MFVCKKGDEIQKNIIDFINLYQYLAFSQKNHSNKLQISKKKKTLY